MRSSNLKNAVRYALAAGVATSLTSVGAYAEDDAAAAELDRVQITGSRIKRTDIETAQPVTIIQRADIERTGLTSLGDLLQDLPAAGSTINTNVNNGGSGSTLVDLRNLGANRTLVLVNGRRWVNNAGGFLGGSVDLNTIPISIVERVEVLKDGASAIYGSDAIAGVVNIITRKDFDGAQVNAQFGQFDDSDGDTEAYDFSIGSTGSRHNAFLNVGYVQQDKVIAKDRELTKEPLVTTGTFSGSSGTPQGRFLFVDSTFTGASPFGLATGVCGGVAGSYSVCNITTPDGSTFANTPANGANGLVPIPAETDFIPFTNLTRFNFAPDNHLLTPQERISLYAQGSYEINDWLTFSTEILYNNRQSDQLLAPVPLFLGTAVGLPNGLISISAQNAYNPFGINLNGIGSGSNLILLGRRQVEAGPRIFEQDVDTFRFGGAFEGSFQAGGRFFDWDVGYVYAENQDVQTTTGQLDLSRVQDALGPSGGRVSGQGSEFQCLEFDGVTPIPGCVSYNIFGGQQGNGRGQLDPGVPINGTISQAQLDYVSGTLIELREQAMVNYTANLSGEIVDLPGGPLGFAVGTEYRREEGFDEPDIITATSRSSGNNRKRTEGSYTLEEYYVEFNLPVHRMITFNVASRFTDFANSAGGQATNDSQKAGIEFRPHADFLIRGTWSEGFRAPNISELFGGNSDSFPTLTDPCAGGTNLAPQCPAGIAVPAAANPQIRITVGSNPALQPETAESITAGVVWSPSFVEGLSVSLDWWSIDLNDPIVGQTGQTFVNACHNTNSNAAACALITRNARGVIVDVLALQANIGGIETEGVDVTAIYNLPEFSWGRIRLVWDTSYLDEYNTQNITIRASDGAKILTGESEFAGTNVGLSSGGSYPKWKSNLDATWSFGSWEATWGMQYIGKQVEPCSVSLTGFSALCDSAVAGPNGFIVRPDQNAQFGTRSGLTTFSGTNTLGSTTYHDAQVSYHWEDWRFTVGIDNITDKDPPICTSCFANSYDPSVYRVPGRFPYLRVSKSF